MTILRAGLIGDHIGLTRLPAALDTMCKANGLMLEFELIDTADLRDFDFARTVDGLRAKGWSGVAVTHPYKTVAAAYAGPAMSPELHKLGASNTLIFGPELGAANTDYTGFLSAWQAQMAQRPGIVAMAGAGGVARAIGPALAKLGATEIRIWDVSDQRARDLAAQIGAVARMVPMDQARDAMTGVTGLVNATPIGMAHHPGTAFDCDGIGAQSWAFDAVYTPTNTQFLRDCRASGLRVLTGFDLFRHMAVRSFQALTGIMPDTLPKLHPDG